MQKIVLLINGAATSGKDTFIDLIGKEHAVIKTSIIDPVKKIASDIGWNGKKENRDRKFLSDLKDLIDSYNEHSFWRTVGYVYGRLHAEGPKDLVIVCIIAREPKDIEAFKAHFTGQGIRVKSILIRRAEAEKNLPDNHADQKVFDYPYDFYIENNGSIEDLQELANKLLKEEIYEYNPHHI